MANSPSQMSELFSSSENMDQNNHSNQKNNHFAAAYVQNESDIKLEIKERKTLAFWTLVTLLFILAIGNLILTMTILGVLKLGHGMQSIELILQENAMKFFGNTDLDHIYKKDGKLESFNGDSMEVLGDQSAVLVNLLGKTNRASTKVKVDSNSTVFKGFSSFQIKNKQNQAIFSATHPIFNNLRNTNHFKSKQIETNRIRSDVNSSLNVENSVVHLKGAEGTKMEGREIVWRADQDIYLQTINGSIILSSSKGIYIDMKKIPIVNLNTNSNTHNKHGNSFVTAQFKICVCMPQGKLFRVPVVNVNEKVYCHHVNMSPQYNPCMYAKLDGLFEVSVEQKKISI